MAGTASARRTGAFCYHHVMPRIALPAALLFVLVSLLARVRAPDA